MLKKAFASVIVGKVLLHSHVCKGVYLLFLFLIFFSRLSSFFHTPLYSLALVQYVALELS